MNEVFKLVAIEKLAPHESINNDTADELHQKLLRENTWTDPIIVSREGLVILDGHHRFEIAKRMNLKLIPAYLVDYDSANIELRQWGTNNGMDKLAVLEAARNKNMFPPKSTQHTFLKKLHRTNIRLSLLRKATVK